MKKSFIQLKKSLTKAFLSLSSEKLPDGQEIVFDGEIIYVGLDVSRYDPNGELIPLEDGEYTIKGQPCIIADGVVVDLPKTEVQLSKETQDDENQSKSEETDKEIKSIRAEFEALKADMETLKADQATLKAINEELQRLIDTPADTQAQQTEVALSTEKPNVIGTKFEKAYKIFNVK